MSWPLGEVKWLMAGIFFLSPDHKNLTKKISLCDKLTYKVEKEIIL